MGFVICRFRIFWIYQWTALKRTTKFQLTTTNQNVTPAAVQRTVQLMCAVTVGVQTEIADISGHAVRHVTFPLSGPKLQ